MEEPRAPRRRGAVRTSLGVLAVLLVVEAAVLFGRTPDASGRKPRLEREPATAGEAGGGEPRQRRLLWWGGGRAGQEPKVEDRGGDPKTGGGMMKAAMEPIHAKQDSGGAGVAVAGGGGGAGLGGGAGERFKKAMRPVGAKVPNVPVSDKVDLVAPGEGLLWQPTSMTTLECPGGEGADADGCDATIRFCLMKIGEYQETPWKFPMATMLQKKSGCNKSDNVRAFRLSALRVYLRDHPEEFLKPNGFVYHETRTGSTLVANMLAHVPSNLVVSENNVAEDPVRHCSRCTDAQKVSVLRDVLPLLGNARNGHEHLFFKFQDSTTLRLMTQAFPDVGWVYLFRDPVEVMVSNLKGAYGKRNRFYEGFDFDAAEVNATAILEPGKPSTKPSRPLMSPCLLSGGGSAVFNKDRPKEEICADRLRTLCQAAVDQLEVELQSGGKGAVMEYTNLPDALTEFIYPSLFGMGEAKLMEHLPYLSEAARMYSKSMSNPESEFAQGTDANYKHVLAEKAYQEAADTTGLSAVYRRLRDLQTWHKRSEEGSGVRRLEESRH